MVREDAIAAAMRVLDACFASRDAAAQGDPAAAQSAGLEPFQADAFHRLRDIISRRGGGILGRHAHGPLGVLGFYRMERMRPCLSSSYSLERPMPRAAAASVGVSRMRSIRVPSSAGGSVPDGHPRPDPAGGATQNSITHARRGRSNHV